MLDIHSIDQRLIDTFSFRSLEEFHYLSPYRQNILRWFPFKEHSCILHIGSQCGVLTSYLLKFGDVYCVEENHIFKDIHLKLEPKMNIVEDLNSLIQHTFDYIVVEGFLDKKQDKMEYLNKLLKVLKPSGQIIILTNNLLALETFSGKKDFDTNQYFGKFSDESYCITKNEWEKILQSIGLQYQFYYPFPNYYFTEYVYNDNSLNASCLKNVYDDSDEYLELFKQDLAFSTLYKHGEGANFSNSFFIIVNGSNDINFSKISSERIPFFSVVTRVFDHYVDKINIFDEGEQHLYRIVESYNRFCELNTNNRFQYCPVKKINQGIRFEYIEGRTLEELLSEYVQRNEIDKILDVLNVIRDISSIGKRDVFVRSKEFEEIFGWHKDSKLENLECYEISNIDLIPENIILSNNQYTILDYEWTFPFQIPQSFILFRAIFHSYALSKLDKDQLQKIYKYYEIDDFLYSVYLEFEINFQNYVSNSTIKEIIHSIGNVCLLDSNELTSISNSIYRINMKQNERDILVQSKSNDIFIDLDLSSYEYSFHINKKAVVNIQVFDSHGKKIDGITANQDLLIGDNYYSIKPMDIYFSSDIHDILTIKFHFYYYNDNAIDEIISLILSKNETEMKYKELRDFVDDFNNSKFYKKILK